MTAKLHYIYDPLCGWCYGAEPLVSAAAAIEGLEIVLHGGELWSEPTRLPRHTREYIQQADARIAQMSGQPFGEAYLQGLLLDPSLVLESMPTIAAVLAAQAMAPKKALAMLRAIQHAHYEQGLHVVRRDVLCDLAESCGLERAAFEARLSDVPAEAHIAESRRFMESVGARGFPMFVLQVDDEWFAVPHQRFASHAAGFAEWLEMQLHERA